MDFREAIVDEIRRSDAIVEDFAALTACGGRLVGSDGEKTAARLLEARLAAIPGAAVSAHEFGYTRWTNLGYALARISPGPALDLPCHPLVGSEGTAGVDGEAVDLGRGAAEDFRRLGERVRGNFALVRHEYPFSRDTIHRRIKFRHALEGGAAGFIVANPMPEAGLVTGGVWQETGPNMPAIGVDHATAQAIAGARIRLAVDNRREADVGRNLIAEIPGLTPEWVVLCAHYDGHDLAHSALDNATGVAAALEILRRFAPHVASMPRGLRVILFTAEETGLLGSRLYVDSLEEAERRAVAVVVNLDTLGGSPDFTCLTSGFAALDGFVARVAAARGLDIATWRELLRNSDHFNFAERGIPALRLIAGFGDPDAGARYLLTEADTAERVSADELRLGAVVAAELVRAALGAPSPIAQGMPG
ncbi:MAG: M28 family metallopeptidase [Defluviicoccus sp.]|nr:M28 family metallopeptidase [Defluviicoccus sp.]MDE0384889.1 M28 family metallopeptidase [Defluviicoccus sp.]